MTVFVCFSVAVVLAGDGCRVGSGQPDPLPGPCPPQLPPLNISCSPAEQRVGGAASHQPCKSSEIEEQEVVAGTLIVSAQLQKLPSKEESL